MNTNGINFLHRDIVKKLEPWLERDEIIVIFGARQVGKTSLLYYLKNKLEEKGKNTFYIDLEDIELRTTLNTPRSLISYLESLGWKRKEYAYVFIDEFHYVENATSTLKYLHDHYRMLKFIITGSSSLKLKFKMGEPLTGRKVVFVLYPLSFREFLRFSKKDYLLKILENSYSKVISQPFLSQMLTAYEEYVLYGGYPKVSLEPSYNMKKALIKEIQSTYIEKEIRSIIREENYMKFKSFMEFIASQNGGLLKVLEASKEIGITRDTAHRYLTILEETYIIGLVKPYASNRQKEIIRMPKAYFLDTGFLNFTIKDFRSFSLRNDTGKLIESSIYTSFLRALDDKENIRFYRTKAGNEIDFILTMEQEIIPVEVKWQKDPKIPLIINNFLTATKSKKAYIISKGIYGENKIGDITIKFKSPWDIKDL